MISLQIRPSIAAGATANVLAGTDLEYLTTPGVLTIWGNSGTGAAATDITHQFRYNAQGTPINPLPTSNVPLGSTADAIKTDEELLLSRFPIPAGSKLIHSVTNGAAAARTPIFRYFFET
jgi:hypothetical protein